MTGMRRSTSSPRTLSCEDARRPESTRGAMEAWAAPNARVAAMSTHVGAKVSDDAERHPTGGKSEPIPARHVDFGDDLSAALLDRTESELSFCVIDGDTHADDLTFLVGKYMTFLVGKSRGGDGNVSVEAALPR